MKLESSYKFSGARSYAEGVSAGSPGVQCEASYPGSRSVKMLYPNGVIADRQGVGNNTFSVEKDKDNLNPG